MVVDEDSLTPRARLKWRLKGNELKRRQTTMLTFAKDRPAREGAFGATLRDKATGRERKITLTGSQVLYEHKKAVSAAFDWQAADIADSETNKLIESDEEFRGIVADFDSREEARRADTLEAKLQLARSLMLSTRAELQYKGAHAMWELSCRPENHEGFAEEAFGLLCNALRSEELRVRAVAAAALWTLAEVAPTLARMPVAQLVPAMLCAARAAPGDTPAKTPLDEPPPLENVQMGQLRVHRALSSTGRTLIELAQWPLGALFSVAGTEAGQRALHRRDGWWQAPSTPLEASASSASLDRLKAQPAPPHPRGPPEPRGSSPWPPEHASGHPKGGGGCVSHVPRPGGAASCRCCRCCTRATRR